jgi:hypothetical protein
MRECSNTHQQVHRDHSGFGERVPCAAVRPIEDMFDHPQVLAEDLVATRSSANRTLSRDEGAGQIH